MVAVVVVVAVVAILIIIIIIGIIDFLVAQKSLTKGRVELIVQLIVRLVQNVDGNRI